MWNISRKVRELKAMRSILEVYCRTLKIPCASYKINVAPGFDLTELPTTWSLHLPELRKTSEMQIL